MTIGTVLLLVFLGTLAVTTLVAAAFFHLNFSNTVINQRTARNIAESTLATALARVWENPNYGQERKADEFVTLNSSVGNEAVGVLAFSKAKASELDVPFSTNNFNSGAAEEGGNGRSVPDSAVHLVAVGRCNGARYRAEAVYYIPPYPNALASTGKIISNGGLLVAGVQSTQSFVEAGTAAGVDQNKLEPAHIASNFPGASAITLGPGTKVLGDVIAVGKIDLAESAEILGEVRPDSGEQAVPDLDIDAIFTKLEAFSENDVLPPEDHNVNSLTVDYFTEVPGDLTVNGDVQLDGGVLYCRGNVNIWGSLHGHGAVFGLKNVTVNEGAEVTASDQIALVAKGDVNLHGLSASGNFFNGLVYSEQNLWAKDITIIGAAVSNSSDGSGTLRLDNVNLVKSPLAVELVLGLPRGEVTEIPVLPPDTKDKDEFDVPFLNLFFSSKKDKSVSIDPAQRKAIEEGLAAALRLSGQRLPDIDGQRQYALTSEGRYSRSGGLNSLDDLTQQEKDAIRVDEFEHQFSNGTLRVFYGHEVAMNREQAVASIEGWKSVVGSVVGDPVSYTVKSKKKKKLGGLFGAIASLFGAGDDDDDSRSDTWDPAAALKALDPDEFLDSLEKPTESDEKFTINLNLNQVFDAADTSRILYWGSF